MPACPTAAHSTALQSPSRRTPALSLTGACREPSPDAYAELEERYDSARASADPYTELEARYNRAMRATTPDLHGQQQPAV